jgi:ferric-dicitrate binding protein FerR (iron transport regulator)
MSNDQDLLRRFTENRDQLSEVELESLVVLLRARPDVAVELKDQLIIDELLSQKFDLSRWHFLSQVDQRLRDEWEGFSAIQPGDFTPHSATAAVIEPTENATTEYAIREEEGILPESSGSDETDSTSGVAHAGPKRRGTNRRNLSRSRWPGAFAAAVLVLALGVAGLWTYASRHRMGVIESITGDVEILYGGQRQPAAKWGVVRFEDRLVTAANSTASVRFQDGTTLRIDAATEAEFYAPSSNAPGKRIFVSQGRVSADVAPQPVGRPMLFESATATAEVVGTSLQFLVAPQQTAVTVTEGQVQVRRNVNRESLLVSQNQFAVVTAEKIAAAAISWPSNRAGLIFVFQTNEQPNLVRSISTGVNRSYSLRPRGWAHLDHNYSMILTGGAFLAEDVDGEILAGCRLTNQLSIEATILPSVAEQVGPARIVTFSTNIVERDFTLGQQGDNLIVRIRTPQTGPNGVNGVDMGLPVCKLVAGEINHVIVSYQPGKLVCYRNGKQVFAGNQIEGDFSGWSAQHLLFGDEYGGERNWAGSLEGVAIYNRVLNSDEAARNAMQYEHLRRARAIVPQIRVRAELIAKSTIPTAAQIQPHKSALVNFKYRIKEVLAGQPPSTTFLVAQWAVLDGQEQPIMKIPVGTETVLLLEPFDQNPQAQQYLRSDDFRQTESGERFLEIRQ